MMASEELSMKRRRHTPEQVVRKLREADRLLGEGRKRALCWLTASGISLYIIGIIEHKS